MQASKAQKVQQMETWLVGRDIQFKSLQNGHIQIFDPTTSRYIPLHTFLNC